MAADRDAGGQAPETAEVLKQSKAAQVTLLKDGDTYLVVVEGAIVTRTRVLGLADADYQIIVEERRAPLRERMAKERAAGAYAAMASENQGNRSSQAQRGGKGGRGGV